MSKEANGAIPHSRSYGVARGVLATAAALVILAACGGGSGGGGTAVLPGGGATSSGDPGSGTGGATGSGTTGGGGTSGSGGGTSGSGGGTGTINPPTLRDQIAALEQSGAYPKLDRSADLAGPDANSNGVRDDIEAWIHSLKLSDVQTKALMQDARATQRTLVVSLEDKDALQRVGEGLMASTKCGGRSFAKRTDFYALASQIEAMTANTKLRAARYMQYNAARSGSSTSYPEGDACEQ